MIAEKMKPYVKNNSAIRMMFEEGNRLRAIYGADKVYDFSLGNPSVPAPECVKEAIIDLVNEVEPTVLHGYMSNAGFEDVRQTIAESLNRRFGTKFAAKNLIMTVGAASGLNVIFKTILNPEEEVIVFAPYFLEYGAYVRNFDGKLVEISPDTTTFQPNLEEFEQKITAKTRAVIVNTPHNPTGVVYSEETIKKLAVILEKKQQEFGSVIYLISDEPYRELAYDGVEVPYLTKYYDNTIVGYSYSKSLSLPGERIGYLVIPDEADGSEELRKRPWCLYQRTSVQLQEQPCPLPCSPLVRICRGRTELLVFHKLQCRSPRLCKERQILCRKQHLRAAGYCCIQRRWKLLRTSHGSK